jgi:hypothetical protein
MLSYGGGSKRGKEMSRERYIPEQIIGEMLSAKVLQAVVKTIYLNCGVLLSTCFSEIFAYDSSIEIS